MKQNIGQYNNHKPLRYISNNIIEYLMYNNEIIWKLLKYQTPDALSKSNLTIDEKRALIYNGWVYNGNEWILEDVTNKAVFRQRWIDDANTEQATMIRIFLSNLIPESKDITTALYTIEIVAHNKSIPIVSDLGDEDNETDVNSENRVETITQQILETLNGAEVGSIGRIFFDNNGNYLTKGSIGVYNNRNYSGFLLTMGCKINGSK